MLTQKCAFLATQVRFVGFVVSSYGVSADPEKVRAIEKWLEPKTIRDVRNFHGLTTFYRQFIKGFSTVMAPITNYLKKSEFSQSNAAAKVFIEIKARIISAPVMRHLYFSKIFEVACDVSGISIGGVLAEEGHLIAYFSEKLNDAKKKNTLPTIRSSMR